MTYTKTAWVNGQAPAISATNLNKIETELETLDTSVGTKLNANAVKTTNTTSDTDTYSCSYVNNQLSGKQPLVNYSTSEVDTGVKWIDGKTIYRKVIETNLTTNQTQKTYSLSSLGLNNISTLVECYSISQSDPKERDYFSANDDQLRTIINSYSNLIILLGNSYPTRPCKVYTIIEYTKTS